MTNATQTLATGPFGLGLDLGLPGLWWGMTAGLGIALFVSALPAAMSDWTALARDARGRVAREERREGRDGGDFVNGNYWRDDGEERRDMQHGDEGKAQVDIHIVALLSKADGQRRQSMEWRRSVSGEIDGIGADGGSDGSEEQL